MGLERDDHKHSHNSLETADGKHASRSGAHYSTRTGRFNEGTAKSRGRTSTKHGTGQQGESLFSVPENEREMWVRDKYRWRRGASGRFLDRFSSEALEKSV